MRNVLMVLVLRHVPFARSACVEIILTYRLPCISWTNLARSAGKIHAPFVPLYPCHNFSRVANGHFRSTTFRTVSDPFIDSRGSCRKRTSG
ncbi:hypothetical protein BDN71DRAFT_671239 [Pleurotus eryngii]|uniref:Secreted protein n=1 Tax=Pleurotus eryngii TaxID=5323 RepID=A0A9P6A0L8_PLEER|nr:hypothetical protein BDN71DRAFT_671239 [Pleurotus eryngii]